MTKNRIEAFSDGVLAIIITIMVLEFKTPRGSDWLMLEPLIPKFIAYGLSFAYVGIYWGNHHHMFQTVKHTTSYMILSNLNLLFWLSLIPFATAWMSENNFSQNTTALYGVILLLCNLSFTLLQKTTQTHMHESDSLTQAYKKLTKKGFLSTFLYVSSIPLAYVNTYISFGILVIVAFIWLVPDKNIEKALKTIF